MAYRVIKSYPKRRRTPYGRTAERRKRVFGKRATKAIQRIAQGPVETKHTPFTYGWGALLTSIGYTPSQTLIIRGNLWDLIPKIKDTATRSDTSMIGNEVMARGFKFTIGGYLVTAAAIPDLRFRFTIYSEAAYQPGVLALLPSDQIFDQDYNATPTWSTWNPQRAKIHYQRTWKVNNQSTGQGDFLKKFYYKSNRKLVSMFDESTVTNSYMGSVKGMQDYWVLEVFGPTMANLSTGLNAFINFAPYFKDA